MNIWQILLEYYLSKIVSHFQFLENTKIARVQNGSRQF